MDICSPVHLLEPSINQSWGKQVVASQDIAWHAGRHCITIIRLHWHAPTALDCNGSSRVRTDFVLFLPNSSALNLCSSCANTVGPITLADMYLHTRRLCKIHHNFPAAPPAPSCHVQIYQNAFDGKFSWQRSYSIKHTFNVRNFSGNHDHFDNASSVYL